MSRLDLWNVGRAVATGAPADLGAGAANDRRSATWRALYRSVGGASRREIFTSAAIRPLPHLAV
jgi:hypothetical protein